VVKWAVSIVLLVLAIPVVAIVTVAVVANVDAGRRLIEQQTASLTGGMVRLQGLSGRFPDALRVAQLQVSDAKGPYVTVNGLALDWSPLKLVHRVAQIDQLQADQLKFDRLPESSGATKSSSSETFKLPVEIDLRHLHVNKAVVGCPGCWRRSYVGTRRIGQAAGTYRGDSPSRGEPPGRPGPIHGEWTGHVRSDPGHDQGR